MERTGTGIGFLHFVSCLTEQVRITGHYVFHRVTINRVGGKRSSFLPTFVFRPLTPPYVPLGIRRFLFWVPFEIQIRQARIASHL